MKNILILIISIYLLNCISAQYSVREKSDFQKILLNNYPFNNEPENTNGVLVINMSSLNSSHLDFSAMPYKNGIVFTSSRNAHKSIRLWDKIANDHYTDLYFAEVDNNGKISNIKPMTSTSKKYHDGVATFDYGKDIMYFTRNNEKGKNKKDLIDLKIYSAAWNGLEWTDITELPFNSNDFSTCHPTINSAGNKMYFSSDRPGGQGGMDIWVSDKINGIWQTPRNLGTNVNSAGNEIFPFIASDGTLYVSSNGHSSKGGLDIYKTTGDDVSWVELQNLGEPFNSTFDDFSFYSNRNNAEGYFSSNRESGLGRDDIYKWKSNGETSNPAGWVAIVDAMTNKPIEMPEVTITGIDGNKIVSDRSTTNMNVKPATQYIITAAKYGYKPESITVNAADIIKGYKLPLEKIKTLQANGNVKNASNKANIPSAKIVVVNRCNNETATYYSDNNGNFDFKVTCGCDYDVTTEKTNFRNGKKEMSTSRINCDQPESLKAVIEMAPLETVVETPKPVVINEPTPIKTEMGELKVGSSFVIKNLYYDYDKYYIRKDASVELDKLVAIMNQYPTMEIFLSSHTDSRGNDAYNLTLSKNRAKAARDYIISKGISENRISADGLGETTLVNECSNGAKCSEQAHQANRRTEVQITKM